MCHFYKSLCPIVSIDNVDAYSDKEVQISRLGLGVAKANERLFILKRHLKWFTCLFEDK